METPRDFILAFLGLFLLTQCNTKQDSNRPTQISSTSIQLQTKNSLTGVWKYNNSIWYSSELILQDNGTFKFHDQSCYGQKFSQGVWTNNNDIIQLISFDTFKKMEQTEANNSKEVVEQKKPKRKLKNGELEYSFVSSKDVQSVVLPGPNDTIRIYLDKVQLQLRNDTLYSIGTEKLPEEAMFHRTKNNR